MHNKAKHDRKYFVFAGPPPLCGSGPCWQRSVRLTTFYSVQALYSKITQGRYAITPALLFVQAGKLCLLASSASFGACVGNRNFQCGFLSELGSAPGQFWAVKGAFSFSLFRRV